MNLYDNVKYLSTKQGISLPDLAEKMGLARTAIYKWKTQTPGIETIEKLAKYFDVSIEFLIGSDHVPEWASQDDMIDLELMLQNNVNMSYAGQELSSTEKQRVQDVLTTIFWEKKQQQKMQKHDAPNLPNTDDIR